MSVSTSRPEPPKKISCWVRPGVFEVRASARRPVSALIKLDLPTLERPANAISGAPIGGTESSPPAAEIKSHAPANRRRPASISAVENSPMMFDFTGHASPKGRAPVRPWQIHHDPLAPEIRQKTLLPRRSISAPADLPRPIAEACGQGRPAFQVEGRARFRRLFQTVWSWSKDRLFRGCVEGFM